MRTALGSRNRIGEALDLLGIVGGVLQLQIHERNLLLVVDMELAHPADHNRLRMNQLFGLSQLSYEFRDALFIKENFAPGWVDPFVGYNDLQAFIEEG